jgi:leucyl/phenylalanyl-tRNA--protein transferase
MRGQLSITGLHVPRRLQKTIRRYPYDIRINTDFAGVITACSASGSYRPESWINKPIIDLYTELHELGFAHSVEAWDRATQKLVGGVYGVALGGAFFGESMFHRATDASKIALVHLTARLWRQGYLLFDTQFVNAHLEQFGVYEIPRDAYKKKLAAALEKPCVFYSGATAGAGGASLLAESPSALSPETTTEPALVSAFLQSITQTSKTG